MCQSSILLSDVIRICLGLQYLSIECKDTTEILWIELLYNVAFSIGRTSILGVAPSYRCDAEWSPVTGVQAKIMVVKDIEREDIEFISKILGVEAGNPAWISIQDPVGDVSGKKAGASYVPKLVLLLYVA